jgi:lauroyl/myristoyl acyltransferase
MHQDPAENPDLEAALAAARAPLVSPAMPPAPIGVRLKTSLPLRALLPTRLVVARAAARAAAKWERSPRERRYELRTMEAIVGGTPRAPEAAALAREHFIEDEVQRALFWQPWKTASIDAASSRHLQQALAQKRGVLLSACHMSPIFLYLSAISARGNTVLIVSDPWFFEQPSHDYWGRRIARWWKGLERREERLVRTNRAFPLLRALLDQRELVLVYFDMPGSRRTSFLGKAVMLASGTAKLAFASDALVLPVRALRRGHRAMAEVAPAIDPRDFSDADQLHDTLAAVHERWILARPHALEDPNRPGAWEGGASASEWARPDGSAKCSGPRPPTERPNGRLAV